MRQLKTVGDRIRAARIERGISQEKLAQLVGYTRANISLIERGVTQIYNAEQVHRIATELGVPLAWLLHGAEGDATAESTAVLSDEAVAEPRSILMELDEVAQRVVDILRGIDPQAVTTAVIVLESIRCRFPRQVISMNRRKEDKRKAWKVW